MDKLVKYFHEKYYPDLDINIVGSAMSDGKVLKSAIGHLKKTHYPDMNEEDMLLSISNGGKDPSKNKEPESNKTSQDAENYLNSIKHKKGRLTMTEAMNYIDKKGLKGKDAYKFLREWSPSTVATIYNDKGLKRRMKDPNYKAPITKDELDEYELYSREIEKRNQDKTPEELEAFLKENQYTPKKPLKVSGKQIIEKAKSSGKTRIEENEDGSYTIYDDESVFKDTETPFGKGLKIYPNAKYDKVLYGKGKDLRNVYKPVEYEPYKGRIPTEQEKSSYSQGNYYTGALDPEYKYYYANAYLEPTNDKTLMSSSKGPFYDINSSAEDVDRLRKVEGMKMDMNEYHQSYVKKQKRIAARKEVFNKIKDRFIGDRKEVGGGSGAGDGF